MEWLNAFVLRNRAAQYSCSPYRNTRSQGTSTRSKIAVQSISSKREPSGWSNDERPISKLSRQMKRRPGVPQGMAKANAFGLGRLPNDRDGAGATNSSSEAGASVARIL